MPTVMRFGPYRFFFYSGDRHEPPHVHVERDAHQVKFWINPVMLQKNSGYNRKELRIIHRLVEDNQDHLLKEWDEHFND